MPQAVAKEKATESWIAAAIESGSLVSPCLVFDLDAVDRVLNLFATYLPGVRLYYSLKANNDPTILNHLHKRGVSFDVASAKELATMLELGVESKDLILSNTIKTPSCIRDLFSRRVPLTTIDNEHDLKALAQEATFHTFRPHVLTRIKVQPVDVQIDLNEKFGCSIDEAVRLLALAHEKGIPPLGVHFHVGTQSWNVETYRKAFASACQVLETARTTHGLQLSTINMGGGYPDELVAEHAGGLEKFFSDLAPIVLEVQNAGFTVLAEPGRVVASGACTAVSQVIGKNTHLGQNWLYLDDGIYGLFSTAHYEQRQFEFCPLGPQSKESETYIIAGPTCDSLDVISRSAQLPSSIRPGDYLVAHNAGAYSISVKSNFNGMAQITTTVQGHALVELSDAIAVPSAE